MIYDTGSEKIGPIDVRVRFKPSDSDSDNDDGNDDITNHKNDVIVMMVRMIQ